MKKQLRTQSEKRPSRTASRDNREWFVKHQLEALFTRVFEEEEQESLCPRHTQYKKTFLLAALSKEQFL